MKSVVPVIRVHPIITKWESIRLAVSIPLVLHGTSGVPDETVSECIKRGICKVNYATDLRIAFTDGMKSVISQNPAVIDPKKYNQADREEVKRYVMRKIKILGSEGRA